MHSTVPVIDLGPGSAETSLRGQPSLPEMDAALQSVGFFLDHRSWGAWRPARGGACPGSSVLRAAAGDKQRYAVTVGGRGWLPPGAEANGYAEGTQTPPDLKESFAVGADQPTGDADVDGFWFQPNTYPAEVPGAGASGGDLPRRMRGLADELLVLCASALRQERDFFTRHTGHATHTLNINWYPPMRVAGQPGTGSVPDRATYGLRHCHHPGPRAGPRRPAGVDRGGRLAGRAV